MKLMRENEEMKRKMAEGKSDSSEPKGGPSALRPVPRSQQKGDLLADLGMEPPSGGGAGTESELRRGGTRDTRGAAKKGKEHAYSVYAVQQPKGAVRQRSSVPME